MIRHLGGIVSTEERAQTFFALVFTLNNLNRGCRLSEEKLQLEGTVMESSNGIFRVKLENDHVVIGHLSGKMKMYKIRVLPGDSVTIELSPYDLSRGRIVRREKFVKPR